MLREPVRHPIRRLLAGLHALAQGLLGMALIALAALAFLDRKSVV